MRLAHGRTVALLAAGALALSASAALAETAGPTQADYIAKADPICLAAFKTALPHPKSKHDIQGYARLFGAMSHRIGSMGHRLEKLEKPPADVFALTNWLASLQSWANHASRAGRALRHHNAKLFRASVGGMNRAQDVRLHISRSYGFQICR